MKDIKFDLKDIVITPAIVSPINSRSECDTEQDGTLPLMASPMDTVISEKNLEHYIQNKIVPCLPRGFEDEHLINKGKYFQSLGLVEIEKDLERAANGDIYDTKYIQHYPRILIDIANGHMQRLIDVIKAIKKLRPFIILMVGNVAHPLTYKNLAMAGADYIRCSIGTGGACTTAANAAINYPIGSLIKECREEKIKGGFWNTKIVIDGGMQGYDDIIKALGLGADYIMLGSIFNKAIESSGSNYFLGFKIPYKLANRLWKKGFTIKKEYRGMSTKAVQRKWGKDKIKTAEGITKKQKVEYTLESWIENFEDYLRTNMSYCGYDKIHKFIGYVDYEHITNAAFKRFNK